MSNNKESKKRYLKNRKERVLRYVQDLKSNSRCADCNKTQTEAENQTLTFDHVKPPKLFTIADSYKYTLTRVIKELEKCEVVCAPCHRRRERKRGLRMVPNCHLKSLNIISINTEKSASSLQDRQEELRN